MYIIIYYPALSSGNQTWLGCVWLYPIFIPGLSVPKRHSAEPSAKGPPSGRKVKEMTRMNGFNGTWIYNDLHGFISVSISVFI